MKISKLFHWLYAIVMLLPIFAISGALLISTFNANAKNEVITTYKYETNEVNDRNDIKIGNIYEFDLTNITTPSSNLSLFYTKEIYVNNNKYSVSNEINDNYYLACAISIYGQFVASLYENNTWLANTISINVNDIDNIYFVYLSNLNNDYLSNVKESSFNIISGYETTNVDSQQVFYNAVDKVTQSPYFNWAYDSFLVAPFSYIVNLFSMPTNSPVVMLLSYWLSISIIWLTFDLVMYVPLLVHRWLDKGVLE